MMRGRCRLKKCGNVKVIWCYNYTYSGYYRDVMRLARDDTFKPCGPKFEGFEARRLLVSRRARKGMIGQKTAR